MGQCTMTVKIENTIFSSPPLRVYRHYHLPFLTLIGSLILVWTNLMERGAAMDTDTTIAVLLKLKHGIIITIKIGLHLGKE